ncbi:pilus assembly protein TadG-related protein [Labrenzia sp. VG12]|uniref:pilus assembly protein TadG-related protein n=1 Tax=Labrenzia sp. VG12 TaxID=2021862 RepID=UPI000B8C6141|nr:pilus assembly protein TadG-related protein [Labrenzia sp. VG12]ASP35668.1 hypothetical protein CHH27_22490 [Labrenzia sp. VG12]
MTFRISQAFARCQRGTIAVYTALLMPVAIGGFGLGAEASFWYFQQRKIQNAADVAAYAAATQLRLNRSEESLSDAALAAAVKTGYSTSLGNLTFSWPPGSGSFAGDGNAVEIALTENHPRLFTSLFTSGTISLSGRAVAQLRQGFPTCILSLDQTSSGAITFTGSSDATLEGCNVHANSTSDQSVLVTGNGKVDTPCVSAVGEVSATSGLSMSECVAPIEYAEAIEDPFSDIPAPDTNIPCEPENVFGGPPSASYTISEGRYCGGLEIRRQVTMTPGVYIVDGGTLKLTSFSNLTGSGVTLYLTNGASVSMAGTANVVLSAPDSGTYQGILIFVDRETSDTTHIFNGSSSSSLDGAIYAASGHIKFAGNSSAGGGCTQIVANTVEITGDAGIGSDCSPMGFNEILNSQLVQLVE